MKRYIYNFNLNILYEILITINSRPYSLKNAKKSGQLSHTSIRKIIQF